MDMLEAVLTHLHNWFPVKGGKHAGEFTIASGMPDVDFLADGQYFRIKGSVFSDGLHVFNGGEMLQGEMFEGEIWALAIPADIKALAVEVGEYQEKNPISDKTSESFGGYSYTRASGSSGVPAGWQGAFASRLAPYRRISDD